MPSSLDDSRSSLAPSSCSSTLWVERRSVPEACLPHPWVALVLSLSLLAVWLSSLLLLSLRCRRHLTGHLAWMIAAVACGLVPSSCASALWVERHSVPEACLPHPWVAYLWLNRRSCRWPVFLLPGLRCLISLSTS